MLRVNKVLRRSQKRAVALIATAPSFYTLGPTFQLS